MATRDELQQVREDKIKVLESAGMDPYPASVPRMHALSDVADQAGELENSEEVISTTGRIMAIRGAGKIMFVVLQDGATRFQAVLKQDVIESEEKMSLFKDAIDI